MNKRELFAACGLSDTPDCVACISGSAGDNAADTIGWENRYGADGLHTDNFIDHWYRSVQCLLCASDCSPEAVEWFVSRGVLY